MIYLTFPGLPLCKPPALAGTSRRKRFVLHRTVKGKLGVTLLFYCVGADAYLHLTYPHERQVSPRGDSHVVRAGPEGEGVPLLASWVKHWISTVKVLLGLKCLLASSHAKNRTVIKLGEEFHVYPRVFSDFVAKFMFKHVPGFLNLQAADDRWNSYFNEARTRLKKQRTVSVSLRKLSFVANR